MLAGALPFVLPLLLSNLRTFGVLTRTGYSYWCAQVYDVPGTSFRFDLATLGEGLRYYGLPIGVEPDLWRISGLPFLVLLAAAGQVVIGLVKAWRSDPAKRDYAVFSLATLAAFLCLYLPYTFRFYWFMYPAYACLLPFLAAGLASLWPGPDLGRRSERRRAAVLLLVATLCLVQRWCLPLQSSDPRLRTGLQLRRLRQSMPGDAVFISNRDPLSVYEDVERGTGRVTVPLNRATEYAWTRTTPRPPADRTVEAIVAASKPVYPSVFEEEPHAYPRRYPGRRIFLEMTNSGTYGGPMPPGFDLVPVETRATVALFELTPRATTRK
jgi:hypothetical protein